MVQGKSSRVSYKNKQQIRKPQEDWVIVRNTHEPIIEEELFEKAQSILQRATKVSQKTGERRNIRGLSFAPNADTQCHVSEADGKTNAHMFVSFLK